MTKRRVIIAAVLFVFAGLMIYTFANPANGDTNNLADDPINGDIGAQADEADGSLADPYESGIRDVLSSTAFGSAILGFMDDNGWSLSYDDSSVFLSWIPRGVNSLYLSRENLNKTGLITIHKEILGELNYNDTFYFLITGSDYQHRDISHAISPEYLTNGKVIVPVVVNGDENSGGLQITLPYGHYKIEELDHEYYSFNEMLINQESTNEFSLTSEDNEIDIYVYNDPTTVFINKTNNIGESEEVYKGDIITYKIILENTGSSVMKSATIKDTLGEGLIYEGLVSAVNNSLVSIDIEETVNENEITFFIPFLDIGELVEITYTAKVMDSVVQGERINNRVVVTGENIQKRQRSRTRNLVDEMIYINKEKTSDYHDQKEVYPGALLTYQINASINMDKEYNTTSPVAKDVVITDTLTGKIHYVKNSLIVMKNNEETTDYILLEESDQILKLQFDRLEKDDLITLVYQAKIEDDATSEDFVTNAVIITGKNIVEEDPVIIEDPVVTPNIVITKQSSKENKLIEREEVYTYTITVENTGSGTAYHLDLYDYLPTEVIYITSNIKGSYDYLHKVLHWEHLENLKPNEKYEFTITVKALSELENGTVIKNNTTVFYDPAEDYTDDPLVEKAVAIDKIVAPVIAVDKTSDATMYSEKKVLNGENIEYFITVRNEGEAAASNIEIEDILPSYVKVVNLNGGILSDDGKTVNWTIDLLNPQEEIIINFTVKVDVHVPLMSVINNKVFAYETNKAGKRLYKGKAVDESTVEDIVVKPALRSEKTSVTDGINNIVTKGSIITYTITVYNDGDGRAKNVVITDRIPEGTKLVLGSITGPVVNGEILTGSAGEIIEWNIASIDEYTSTNIHTVSFQVEVTTTYQNTLRSITNIAVQGADNSKRGRTNTTENPLMEYGDFQLEKLVIEPYLTSEITQNVDSIENVDRQGLFKGILKETGVTHVVTGFVKELNEEISLGVLTAQRIGNEWIFTFIDAVDDSNADGVLLIRTGNSFENCNDSKIVFEIPKGESITTGKNGVPSAGTNGNNISLCLAMGPAVITYELETEELHYRLLSTNQEVFVVDITGTDIMGNPVVMTNVLIDQQGNILTENIKLPYGTYSIKEQESDLYKTKYYDEHGIRVDELIIAINDDHPSGYGYIKNKDLKSPDLKTSKPLEFYEKENTEGGFDLWRRP